MKRFRKYFFPICAGFATTVGLVFGYSIVFPPPPNLLVGERFNFAKVLEEKGSEFPGIGFRFDSSNLVGLDGLQKNPDSANNLTLLVVLNPSCKACDISADLYNSVRASAQKINVHYYPCSFIPLGPNFNLTSYAEKFGFDDFLTWNGGSEMPMELTRFQTPTHILLNSDGIIIRVWPGTNGIGSTRRIMGEQIGEDLLIIVDTLNATLHDNKLN